MHKADLGDIPRAHGKTNCRVESTGGILQQSTLRIAQPVHPASFSVFFFFPYRAPKMAEHPQSLYSHFMPSHLSNMPILLADRPGRGLQKLCISPAQTCNSQKQLGLLHRKQRPRDLSRLLHCLTQPGTNPDEKAL